MYVNVKCPNIYIKSKTFIIRSYISVSSKPSKTQIRLRLRRFGRNRNITPDNKCLTFYIYIYIYIYIHIHDVLHNSNKTLFKVKASQSFSLLLIVVPFSSKCSSKGNNARQCPSTNYISKNYCK